MGWGPSNCGREPDLTACLVGLQSHSRLRRGCCLTRTGSKYVGSFVYTESLRMNVGYTNSFSKCFFVNTYDTVHIVLIKIHIIFTIAYNTYWDCRGFFSRNSEPFGSSVTPFWGAKRPLSPSQKNLPQQQSPYRFVCTKLYHQCCKI